MACHIEEVIFVTFRTRQMAYGQTRDLAQATVRHLTDNRNRHDRILIMVHDGGLAEGKTKGDRSHGN